MKYTDIKLCVMVIACGGLLCGTLNAADFSKKSDTDLIKLSGVVKVEDFPDYKIEVTKRLKKKSSKDAQDFREKLKIQYEKATENMSVKELRAYKKATHEAMEKRISSMSVQELKESGLKEYRNSPKCPHKCSMDEKNHKDKKHKKEKKDS